MRGIIIFFFVAVATALPQGYNYNRGRTHTEAIPTGFGQTHHSAASAPAASYSGLDTLHGASSISSPSISHAGSNAIGHSNTGFAGGSITKNFFIHSAPEDTDEDILADSESGVENKKYNIVFVKAPSQSAKSAALALRKAQSQEKTLIYVLNKNLDASDLQAALQSTPTEPTKPEVVFIKYKTPEEAVHAQHQIQEQYEALGGGPSFVANEEVSPISSVVGSLGSSSGHSGSFGHGGAHGGHLGAASSPQGSASYLPPSKRF